MLMYLVIPCNNKTEMEMVYVKIRNQVLVSNEWDHATVKTKINGRRSMICGCKYNVMVFIDSFKNAPRINLIDIRSTGTPVIVFVKTKKDRDQMLEHLKIQCITNDGMEVEVFDNMREVDSEYYSHSQYALSFMETQYKRINMRIDFNEYLKGDGYEIDKEPEEII